MKNFTLTLLVTTLSVLLSGCNAPKEPEFKRLRKLRISGLKKEIVTVSASARFNNPNLVGGKLTHSDIAIEFNGVKLTQITQSHSIDIGADSDFDIPFSAMIEKKKIKAENDKFWRKVLADYLKNDLEVTYTGFVVIDILDTSIKVPFTYTETTGIRDPN